MRQKFARSYLAGVALSLILACSGGQWAWAEEPAEVAAVEAAPFDPDMVNTFSGAFLAARTADTDSDFDMAVKLYQKALALDPGNIEVQERLMLGLFLSGRFDEGVKLAETLKDDPSIERLTTIARGIEAIRQGNNSEAYKILTYKGPNDLDRMVNTLLIAWGKMGEGKGAEAIQVIDKMQGPEWFAIFKNYHAGIIAAATGDFSTARRKLNEAVADRQAGSAANDTYMRSVIALAVMEANADNKQKALDAISTGESFAPSYTPLQSLRQKIEAGEKINVTVRTAIEGAASVLFSVGGALNQSLANAPERQNGQDIVAFYLETAHALDPKSADTLVLLGGLAESLNQSQRAIDFYSQVPEGSPLRRISEMQLGLNLAQSGKVEEAKQHLKKLIETYPDDVRGYVAYGSVLSDNKNYEEMAKVYDKAVDVIGPVPKKSDWNVFFQRAIAYERLKKWPLAEPNFKKALELYPDQPQVLNYLGYSWVDMNIHLEEGLDMIRRAVDLRPDDGYIVDSLGWAYYRLGRFDDATAELERAVELKAGDATINDHLGDIYWRVGRKLEAVYQWQRALTMKPEETEIPKIEAKIKDGLPPLDIKPVPANIKEGNAIDGSPKTQQDLPADPTMIEPFTHKVNAGDSLWNIARDNLGDGHRFAEIIALNPAIKRNPDMLRPDDILQLPPVQN